MLTSTSGRVRVTTLYGAGQRRAPGGAGSWPAQRATLPVWLRDRRQTEYRRDRRAFAAGAATGGRPGQHAVPYRPGHSGALVQPIAERVTDRHACGQPVIGVREPVRAGDAHAHRQRDADPQRASPGHPVSPGHRVLEPGQQRRRLSRQKQYPARARARAT